MIKPIQNRVLLIIALLLGNAMCLHAQEYKRGNNWVVGFDPQVKMDISNFVLLSISILGGS